MTLLDQAGEFYASALRQNQNQAFQMQLRSLITQHFGNAGLNVLNDVDRQRRTGTLPAPGEDAQPPVVIGRRMVSWNRSGNVIALPSGALPMRRVLDLLPEIEVYDFPLEDGAAAAVDFVPLTSHVVLGFEQMTAPAIVREYTREQLAAYMDETGLAYRPGASHRQLAGALRAHIVRKED